MLAFIRCDGAVVDKFNRRSQSHEQSRQKDLLSAVNAMALCAMNATLNERNLQEVRCLKRSIDVVIVVITVTVIVTVAVAVTITVVVISRFAWSMQKC